QELRRRPAAGRPDDLVIRDGDAEMPVGALQQDVVNELIGDLVLDLLLVLAAQARAPLLAPVLLEGRLVLQLERLRPHHLAVHLEHDVLAAAQDVGDLAEGEPGHERNAQHIEDGLGPTAYRTKHIGSNSRAEATERAISVKVTTGKLKRFEPFPIDSPPEQTLSSSNSHNYLGRGLHQRDREARKAVAGEPEGAELRPPGRRIS